MRSRDIARRYAEALYELAAEENSLDSIEQGYANVIADLAEVPDFQRFLAHPLVPRAKKIALFERSFPDLPPYLSRMFALLIRNRREGYLDLIYDEFCRRRATAEGIVRVKVLTAQELSAEDRARLADRLAEGLGRRVKLEEEVDRSLLSGLRIEVDGKVIDGTLKAKLEDLRTLLVG